MKRLKYILLFILFITINPVYANELYLKSNNAVLYNLNDNRIIYEKNKDQKVSIASLTKLMTALVAAENIEDFDQKVKLDKSDYEKLVKQDAAASSLKRDREYTYTDLLNGLILESGADCANALARLTTGNEENFVKKMNEKAKELGMNNSSFANPIGLDDKNNYSTMSDMAILLKEDLKNPILNDIIRSLHYTLTDGTKIDHTIYDYMDHYKISVPGIEGGKTGYEISSGYALASIASKDNVTLMMITSKAKDKPEHILDAKNAYTYVFENYDYLPIIKDNTILVTLKTKFLNKKKINIKADKNIVYYIDKNYNKNDIKTVYEGKKVLTLKDRYNSKLGNLKIYYKNKQIANYPIVLNEKVYPHPVLIVIVVIPILLIVIKLIKPKRKRRKRKAH